MVVAKKRVGRQLMLPLFLLVALGALTLVLARDKRDSQTVSTLGTIRKLVSERNYSAASEIALAALPTLDADTVVKAAEDALAALPNSGEVQYCNSLLSILGRLRHENRVTDDRLRRMVTRQVARLEENPAAWDKAGSCTRILGALVRDYSSERAQLWVAELVRAKGAGSAQSFRSDLLGRLKESDAQAVRSVVKGILAERPPSRSTLFNTRDSELVRFLARTQPPETLPDLAREIGQSGTIGILQAVGEFDDSESALIHLLMLCDHRGLFVDSQLSLALSLWGTKCARARYEEGGSASLATWRSALITKVRGLSSVRLRSFGLSAVHGACRFTTEKGVPVDASEAELRWVEGLVAATGKGRTRDEHRLSGTALWIYGGMAKDPDPLFEAVERCRTLSRFGRASGAYLAINFMIVRGVVDDGAMRRLHELEDVLLRDDRNRRGVSSLASKVLQQNFLRTTSKVEQYCNLVLETQPAGNTGLRTTAEQYLADIGPRREALARRTR